MTAAPRSTRSSKALGPQIALRARLAVATAGPGPAGHPSVTALQGRFGATVLHHEVQAGDQHVVFVDAARNRTVLGWLRDDPEQRYDLLVDVTAVDYGGGRPIQIVYQLWSVGHKRALRVKCELPLDGLSIDSVVELWNAANWLEREVYDLFGVDFRGHPDLRRILMPQNYAEGHPLRKDFPLRGHFSRGRTDEARPVPGLSRRLYTGGVGGGWCPRPRTSGAVRPDGRGGGRPVTEKILEIPESGLRSEPMLINLGPQHPATPWRPATVM